MNDKLKTIAVITAGGNSVRFGSNKLLEKIGDLTVIETTILKFIGIVDEIIIPCQDEIKKKIEKSKIYQANIKFAQAGKTRQLSVYNAINSINKADVVLIHDGARPFIDKETILKTIELTVEKKAVVVGKMAIDTIKQVQNGKIVKTLDRNEIFQAQTPQAFNFELIKNIHEECKNNPNFTDDSSMAEYCGIEVFVLDNKKNNKKITTKEDLA